MENPITLIEGLPLWGKILLGVIALVLLLLVWKPWSSGAAAAASAAPVETALPNTLAPGQQDEIVSNPLPASPSVPVSSAPSTSTAPTTSTVGTISGVELGTGVGYEGYEYQPYIFPAGTTEEEAAAAIYGANNPSAIGVFEHYNPNIASPSTDIGGISVDIPSSASAPVLGGSPSSALVPA